MSLLQRLSPAPSVTTQSPNGHQGVVLKLDSLGNGNQQPTLQSSENSEGYFLAIDGGGTKTRVICVDEGGKIAGEGLSGPTSLAATSVGAASFNLKEGIRQALETVASPYKIHCLAMGLAGMDTPKEEAQARAVFGQVLHELNLQHFILVNDTLIGLESASDQPNGIVLIAGTGSNCFGRNQQGQTAKAGGYDYFLTDQGSGYWIGHQVLRAAVSSFDGSGPKSVLEELVCQHFHIATVADLKDCVYNPLLTKPEVAACSMICSEAYTRQDPVAIAIFDQVVTDLEKLVTAVVSRLELNNHAADCILVGSVINEIEYVHQQLISRLVASYPQFTVKKAETDPVFGALKLAMECQV